MGSGVVVPLGTTLVNGVAVSISQNLSELDAVKKQPKSWREVHSVSQKSVQLSLNPLLLQLAKDIAAYYLVPVSACFPLIVPPIRPKVTTRVFTRMWSTRP